MIRSDFHVHSKLSGDSQAEMVDMIESAIRLGLTHLCFTEHHDIDLISTINFLLDFDAYEKTFFPLQAKYRNRIQLLFGIELGVQPHLYSQLTDIANKYPFDFIICSNHVAGGVDPYQPIYFEGKDKYDAYNEFFEDIFQNAKAYSDFDVYGHLDYMIRYAPYEDKHYMYETCKTVLDNILMTIIEKGKGIEINTSGFKYGLKDSHPSHQVIKRYRQLGGEIITVGSDAHSPEHIGTYFDLASDILTEAGFKYYTIFKERKPEFIKLS